MLSSKYGLQQQERPDGRGWTVVHDGHAATVRKQIEGVSWPRNRLCTRANRRDTMAPSYADTSTHKQQS